MNYSCDNGGNVNSPEMGPVIAPGEGGYTASILSKSPSFPSSPLILPPTVTPPSYPSSWVWTAAPSSSAAAISWGRRRVSIYCGYVDYGSCGCLIRPDLGGVHVCGNITDHIWVKLFEFGNCGKCVDPAVSAATAAVSVAVA